MINGNCTGDANPDWWFPEMPSGIGRPTPDALKAVAEQTNYALKLCASCPVKAECLAEGMKTEQMRKGIEGWGNLPFGIWGGLMAAERLEIAGVKREHYPPRSRAVPARAYDLFKNLEPLLRR
jgi:hypothetical protein